MTGTTAQLRVQEHGRKLGVFLMVALLGLIEPHRAGASLVYVSSIGGGVSVIHRSMVIKNIPVGASTGITIAPDGTYAYVGGYGDGIVSIIDTRSNAVTGTIPVGEYPWDTAFTPDGKTAYVTDEALNVVWMIDTATRTVVGSPIPLGTTEATEITISPDGAFGYVVSICGTSAGCDINVPSTVSIIDTSSNTLVNTLTVGTRANGIAITKGGDRVYVANQCADPSCQGGSVSVIDTDTQSVIYAIPITGQFDSQYITVAPNGKLAYVSNTCGDAFCSQSGTVSTIDLKTNSVIGSPIPVGQYPAQLGATDDGRLLYVVNQSGSVSVIATATNTVIATIPIGDVHPGFLAIKPERRPCH
jgi:YVTN family beta-propeller protein